MSSPGNPNRARTVVIAGVVLLLFLLAAVWMRRTGVNFDFRSFLAQLKRINPLHAIAAVLLIYSTYFVRSYRWAVFIRRDRRVSPFALLGTQFTGFAAVAIFGRIADLSRPYLVANKTRLPLAGQVAVYTIERMFDLGAAALIFSSALAFTPRSLPHHEIFVRVGVASLAGTLFLAAFAVSIRLAGVRVAAILRRLVNRISPKAGSAIEEKVLGFREGLVAVSSAGEAAIAGVLSLVLWLMIALAYVETAHSFVAEPTLANLSFSRTMLLMGASIGGSLLQLPILGWFTQIATTAAAMHGFYGTPIETATACGALLLVVTFISVIPVGLIYARLDRVSLGDLRSRGETTAANVEEPA